MWVTTWSHRATQPDAPMTANATDPRQEATRGNCETAQLHERGQVALVPHTITWHVPYSAARHPRLRNAGRTAALVCIAAIAWLTLRPLPTTTNFVTRTACLLCADFGAAELLGNVLLFLPLGATLAIAGLRARAATAVALVLSAGIELAQYYVVVGRVASPTDVLTNTLGAAIGALALSRVDLWVRPSARLAPRLVAIAAIGWLGALGFGGWALDREVDDATYRYQLRQFPFAPGYAWFQGEVDSARVNDVPVRRFERGPIVVGVPIGERAHASVTARFRDSRLDFVPMLVVRAPRDTIPRLAIGQRGTDAMLIVGTRGRRAHFRPSIVLIRGALPVDLDTTRRYTLTADLLDDSISLAFASGGTVRQNGVRLSPASGWSALTPTPAVDGPFGGAISLLWLGALAAPLGYWTGSSVRLRRWSPALGAAIVAVVLTAGLAGVPAATGYVAIGAAGWLASALGAGLAATAPYLVRHSAAGTSRTRSPSST